MKLSSYFAPFSPQIPQGAHTISSKLMLQAGLIRQVASGLYSWLPAGTAVLNNIVTIIREELNKVGAQEILMPCMQPLDLWRKSGRCGETSDLREQMLVARDRNGDELTFTPTAEELICELVKNDLQSYKTLPQNLYQIQWKFRDEIRPRYGVMRAREFLMKDSYSFANNKNESLVIYEAMLNAYLRIGRRLELPLVPVAASTGAIGGTYSHEIHVIADSGESKIFFEDKTLELLQNDYISLQDLQNFYAAEEEKHDPQNCPLAPASIKTSKSIEIGHLFHLGTKYSDVMELRVQNAEGKLVAPDMGCYGIGVSRLVAAVIEHHHDAAGIIWPASIAPFEVILVNLAPKDAAINEECALLYARLQSAGFKVLYDDTSANVKEKLDRADFIGIPCQVRVGPRKLSAGLYEVKLRRNNEIKDCNKTELLSELNKILRG